MSDITLDEYRAGPLARWQDDASAAHAAASEAMWLATCQFARQCVSIIVSCHDASSVRLVMEKLQAYFTDEPALELLRPKFTGEQVTIQHVIVLVLPRDSSRRPRGVVATVEMRGCAVVSSELPNDMEIARSIAHALTLAMHNDPAAAVSLAQALFPETDADWVRENFGPASYQGRRDEALWDEWRAVNGGVPPGSSLEMFVAPKGKTKITTQRPPCRQEEIVSPEFEHARAESMGKDEMNGNSRSGPPLIGPRWKR
jgi:hypothetical protein